MLLSTGESINIFRGPLWGTVYTWHCITRVTLLYWDDVWHGKNYTVRPPDDVRPWILMPSVRPYRLPDGMGLTMALGGGTMISVECCSVAYEYPGPVLHCSVLGPCAAAGSFGMICLA